MEKHEIIALIDALCERPLEDSQAEPSAELQAFCREAAKALSQAGDIDMEAGRSLETVADSDQLIAALATLLSGSNVEAARRTLADAAGRSDTVRLEAEATLAFVDAIEQSPQAAPAHLVEELLVADALTMPRAGAARSSLWSRMVGGFWPARSISRTLVPDRITRSSSPCGHVLGEAIASQRLQKNECSKNSGVMPSSPGSNSSKIFCAS